MSYSKAQQSPFWATAVHRMHPGAASVVRGLHGLITRSSALKPHIWLGSGWRNDSFSSEHGSGRAIDIMVSPVVGRKPTAAQRAAGLALVEWLIANAKTLNIQWIIFSRDSKARSEIWNPARGGWRALADRKSISANHVDHIHVYFGTGARWPSSFNSKTVGKASLPKSGSPAPAAKPAAPKASSTPLLSKGSKGAEVKKLQSELLRVFPAYAGPIKRAGGADGIFGAGTEAVVKEFQRRAKVGVDGIVGPATRAALKKNGVRL